MVRIKHSFKCSTFTVYCQDSEDNSHLYRNTFQAETAPYDVKKRKDIPDFINGWHVCHCSYQEQIDLGGFCNNCNGIIIRND